MAKSKDTTLLPLSAALAGVLAGAAPTGLLVHDAEARVAPPAIRRRDQETERDDPLLVIAPEHQGSTLLAGHSSHRSHSSHSSHYSGSGHYSGSSGGRSYVPDEVPEPAPRKPKPAHVSFVAFPGGAISVDGKPVGHDSTKELKLSAGTHTIVVVNRFLGEHTVQIELSEGQTGVIEIKW